MTVATAAMITDDRHDDNCGDDDRDNGDDKDVQDYDDHGVTAAAPHDN